MTGSLRESVAEILENIARCLPDDDALRNLRGAATLRWADDPARDPEGLDRDEVEAMERDLERHERVVGEIRDLWTAQLVKATALTPARFRDAIGEAVAGV